MKMLRFPKVILALLLSVAAVTVTSTAKAQITCDNWTSGGSTSQSFYDCDFSNGSKGGTYENSYGCYDNSYNDVCTITYTGGNCYSGPCTIVFVCSNGSYYCNIDSWNGTESIQCDDIPKNCEDIYICKTPPATVSAVPEPSTVVAGLLMLIPFGISAVRILRRHKAA